MPEPLRSVDRADELTNRILAHYDTFARDLPWRSLPGQPLPNPYHVWLSEIMLQQTTVAAVKPYFEAFRARWPNVQALANARDEDVMQAWAGLGYYARARNLLKCARAVVELHGGRFPQNEAALLALPGIGPYTAAAISSIAFGRRAVVVDGNVERVITRHFAIEVPISAPKSLVHAKVDILTPAARAGDFAQAMMDLGATICTPKSPKCDACPIAKTCAGKADPLRFPVKLAKAKKPSRTGTALWIERKGAVQLVRRPDKGLLGGMLALPSIGWDGSEGKFEAGGTLMGSVTHVFTHFSLSLQVVAQPSADIAGGEWWPIDQLDKAGLPTVFRKAVNRALGERS